MSFRTDSDIDIFLPLEELFVFDFVSNLIRWPDTLSVGII
jgi:hypothetical protein